MRFQQQPPTIGHYWIMKQSWRNLLFAHWPIPVESLRQYVPKPLQIDTFEGFAWIGIVGVMIEGIYLSSLPWFSLVEKFPQINARTYVHYNGKPGIYFLSLDAPHWSTYTIAKRWFRLPYYHSQIIFQKEHDGIHYISLRKDQTNPFSVKFNGKIIPSSEGYFAKQDTIDYWLTERHFLYSVDGKGRIYCDENGHPPWRLQKAEGEIYQNTITKPFHIQLSDRKPLLHYSAGVDATISNIKSIEK